MNNTWRIHPLIEGQKKPKLEAWQHRATTDPAQIAAWWRQWPHANRGIATGEASGLWVLDVDVGDGHARSGGDKTLARLIAKHGPLPPTYTVRTAGGGTHYYFRWPSDGLGIKKRQVPDCEGLDSIGEGGYVVAPPSVVGDRAYTVVFEAELAEAPAWLLAYVRAQRAAPAPAPTLWRGDSPAPTLDEVRSALAALSADCDRDTWIRLGMAVREIDATDEGWAIWDAWSATAAGRYPGPTETRKQWASMRGEGITKATLFGLARDAGWRPPDPADEILRMRGLGQATAPAAEATPEAEGHAEHIRALMLELEGLDAVARAERLLSPGAIAYAAALRHKHPELYAPLRALCVRYAPPVAVFDREVAKLLRRPAEAHSDVLANYVGTGEATSPRPLSDITAQIAPELGECGGRLFVRRSDGGEVRWLHEPVDLSAWARRRYTVDWGDGPTWGEVLSDAREECERYEAVLDVPHTPPIPRVWYTRALPEPSPTYEHLNRFLALFNPATIQDGELIMACIATLVWGGPPASRPAFCFSSDFGRGVGKSATAHAIAALVGYALAIDNPRDERLVSRVLGYEGRTIIVDNIKGKFDSASIEALITTPVINGHRMHVGQSKTPNYYVWLLTANTPELSADLAQRCIPIKIGPPRHGEDFAGAVATCLAGEGKWLILADVAAWLQGPVLGYPEPDRWSQWQRAVLARCADPEGLQQLILQRRGAQDADAEEARVIYEALWERARLSGGADAQGRYALSPSEVVQALRPVLGDRADSEVKVASIYEKMKAIAPMTLIERKRGGKAGRAYWVAPVPRAEAGTGSRPRQWPQ